MKTMLRIQKILSKFDEMSLSWGSDSDDNIFFDQH